MVLDPQGAARPVRAPLVLAAAALALLMLVPLAWPGPPTSVPALANDREQDQAPATAISAPQADAAELAVERTEATPAAPDPLATLSFERRVDLIAATGSRTAELAQADEFAEARRSDDESRAQFAALMAAFPDAGERAIAMASATAADPAGDSRSRRVVLQLVVAADCARRHALAESVRDFSRCEPLVQALLDVMPMERSLAEMGAAVLTDQPFLRAVHEATVLELVRRAAEGGFERRIATRLLLTLWANLQRTGERTSDELARLSLLLLADAYRELLATDTQPAFRTDLVAGVGFVSSAAGREIAELALRNDPAPEVRIQAAFALTAIGDAGAGERAIASLLDEPRIAGDPHRLGALVLAMQNLEAAGDVNALDRLGQRLRTMPLSPAGREQLEAMLARALPGGRYSANEVPTPPGAQPR